MDATPDALKRRQIAHRVAEAYAALDGVDSVAVGGSTARGSAHEFSDIDIWVTCSSQPDDAARKHVLDTLNESGEAQLMRDIGRGVKQAETMVISGVDIGLALGANDDLLGMGENRDTAIGTSSESGIADFYDCMVLHDPKGLYDGVKRRLADYPVDAGVRVLKRKLCTVVSECALDIPLAVRNENRLWLLAARSGALEELIRAVFILNRRYFARMKDAEWLMASMTHLPADFLRNVGEYAGENDIRRARNLLISMAEDVASLVETAWPDALPGDAVSWLYRLPEDVVPTEESYREQ